MSVDLIRYDLLVQDALRAVVRRVLTDVARDGLPGEHHLYVSFDTRAPGVRLSNRLKERYPEEMTIVLQHQFWDLVVTELFFEVGLSFNGIPERLHVPFDALKGFFDPSVKFGLQFEPPSAEEAAPETEASGGTGGSEVASLADARPAAREPAKAPTSVPSAPAARPQPAAGEPAPKATATKPAATKPATDVAKDKPAATAPKSDAKAEAVKAEATKSASGAKADKAKPDGAKSDGVKSDEAKEGGAQVVRLDAFRKK